MSDDLTLTERANNLLLPVQDYLAHLDDEERQRLLIYLMEENRTALRAVWLKSANLTRAAAAEHIYAAAKRQGFSRRDAERLRLIMQSMCLPEPKE